ncbi:ABC-2 type transport system permease protein [Paenibacillus cellulosilyticus]|uniref:ABC-2 type transport system permease protein n=1 Tax=Paenibacillus cellulosilyticus TaxID=375489 RepID=A0A2V2YKQ0_9BACL|nr:ABC transporter permease subunit [Paenibacillus cellulosilyticus]PWV93791.1 ABC-2 type transport system permease protein [Paenibacillus cellulosilyticus]QKS47408.1 ABC transporter permease subunit [Paenibacillus cellulosilyticus]
MGNFMELVRNENMKIYSRLRTWIMMGIMLVIMLAASIVVLLLDEGVKSMWTVLNSEVFSGTMLVTIFTVIIAADSVAGEFSSGTIKLLLIRPWSRSKILLSKYISVIQFAIFFLAVLFVWTYIWNGLFFGFSSGSLQELTNESSTGSVWSFVLSGLGLQFISMMLTTVTISFLLSTVFRSGGLSIGLSLFLMFMSDTIAGLMSLIDKPWKDYFWFMQSNLTQYLSNGPDVTHEHTIYFSLGILLVYYVVFLAITWWQFMRRDITS